MIDAHIHLDQYDIKTLTDFIDIWKDAGIKRVIAVSNNLASSYKTLELQLKHPDFISACVGFHPELPIPTIQDIEEWKRLIRCEHHRITAIGEIGLPHYNQNKLSHSSDEVIDVLKQYIEEAMAYQLPVVLHAVHDKANIVYSLLQEIGVKHAHFHWLKAPETVVKRIISAGYYVSVTPEVCYKARDQKLAKMVPLKQLLIETDGPWTFEGKFKGKQTTPLLLKDVIQQLSIIKGESMHMVSKQTSLNTMRCYKI